MKTYKTWEVVKMLTENPKLMFKNERHGGILEYSKSGQEELVLLKDEEQKDFLITSLLKPVIKSANGNINDEWTLIQQPVTFMEAIKAYSEGKTIVCNSSSFGARTYDPSNNLCKVLDNSNNALTHNEILKGTWTILED